MKQFYLLSLILTLLAVTEAYTLRNSNGMENQIESNYSNFNVNTENNNSIEKEENQIKSLKGIIENLVNIK